MNRPFIFCHHEAHLALPKSVLSASDARCSSVAVRTFPLYLSRAIASMASRISCEALPYTLSRNVSKWVPNNCRKP